MKPRILASLLLIFPLTTLAQLPQIDELMANHVPTAAVGLWVQDAESKEVLYTHNPSQGFTPASITKSFTAAATLLDLAPDYAYQTTLAYDKTQHQGTRLNGDLAVIFTGDPSLTTQDFNHLLLNIKTLGVAQIDGDILIDNSYFSKPYTARGTVAEDAHWYFGTPVTSIILDENQIPVTVKSGARLGQRVTFSLNTPINAPLTANVTTVSEEESKTLCQLNVVLNPKDNGIAFYGCWPINTKQPTTQLKVALANPELRVEQLINDFLQQEGIVLTGKIRIAPSQQTPDTLAQHTSAPLPTLNAMSMQRSNNLYANSLAKVLGKNNYQRGTLQAGSYAIVEILKNNLNLPVQKMRLFDGSGESTYNQITPEITAQLLQAMYDHENLRQPFFDTMEVSGPQHSFYSRLPKSVVPPVYMKTGSMTGVSNITGYLKTQHGRTLIFVCLLNQLPLDRSQAHLFEQKLLEQLNGM